MTQAASFAILNGMSDKPGRRYGTSADFQEAVRMRLRRLKEASGLKNPAIAAELSARMGRPILADTYRKWETESLLPHDAILPLCDILRAHVFTLLGDVSAEELDEIRAEPAKVPRPPSPKLASKQRPKLYPIGGR